jgi:hypothetical protein
VKTEIAPDFNIAEETARAGVRGAIEKEIGGEWGDLLKDILNPKPKDNDPENDSRPKN